MNQWGDNPDALERDKAQLSYVYELVQSSLLKKAQAMTYCCTAKDEDRRVLQAF